LIENTGTNLTNKKLIKSVLGGTSYLLQINMGAYTAELHLSRLDTLQVKVFLNYVLVKLTQIVISCSLKAEVKTLMSVKI